MLARSSLMSWPSWLTDACIRRPLPQRWPRLIMRPSNLHDHPTGDSAKDNPDRLTGPCPPAHALLAGIAAGALAGFCEELGWTGFAYPRMRARFGWLPAALLLGVLWGLRHLPVVDSLRAASPHGRYWPEYFAAFIAVLAAIRVLIAWTYVHTGSLRMAQLLHASSTGFLVILSAPRGGPRPGGLLVLPLHRRAVGNCHHRRLAPAQAGSRPPPRSLSVVGVAAAGRARSVLGGLAADVWLPTRTDRSLWRGGGLQGRLCLFFLARGAVLAGARPW